jgi:hypothetical protein
MSEAFTSGLIRKTDPSPYDQAVFIDQAMINEALYNMWGNPPENCSTPLQKFEKGFSTSYVNQMSLAAPAVKLMVTTGQDPQLYFILNMTSGYIKMNTVDDPETHELSIEYPKVENWTFGFPVAISRECFSSSFSISVH